MHAIVVCFFLFSGRLPERGRGRRPYHDKRLRRGSLDGITSDMNEYEIEDKLEAGMSLLGSEVKTF